MISMSGCRFEGIVWWLIDGPTNWMRFGCSIFLDSIWKTEWPLIGMAFSFDSFHIWMLSIRWADIVQICWRIICQSWKTGNTYLNCQTMMEKMGLSKFWANFRLNRTTPMLFVVVVVVVPFPFIAEFRMLPKNGQIMAIENAIYCITKCQWQSITHTFNPFFSATKIGFYDS